MSGTIIYLSKQEITLFWRIMSKNSIWNHSLRDRKKPIVFTGQSMGKENSILEHVRNDVENGQFYIG